MRWQGHVSHLARTRSAPFDGKQALDLLAFAIALSLGTRGLTGEDATYAAVEAWTPRTRSRYMDVLLGAGLVTQTEAPTRRRKGQPGRRGRYALTIPNRLPLVSVDVATDSCDATGNRFSTTTTESLASCEREPAPVCQKNNSQRGAVIVPFPMSREVMRRGCVIGL